VAHKDNKRCWVIAEQILEMLEMRVGKREAPRAKSRGRVLDLKADTIVDYIVEESACIYTLSKSDAAFGLVNDVREYRAVVELVIRDHWLCS